MANSELSSPGGDHQPLHADLTDIAVSNLTQNVADSRHKHFIVICVDGKQEFKSKKWTTASGPQCQGIRFLFRPSSTMTITIFRKHLLPFPKSDPVGQYLGNIVELLENDKEHELRNKDDVPIQACIKIKLSLIEDFRKAIMDGVDASLPRLSENRLLATGLGGIDMASSGYVAVETLGTYVTPLGQALQLIVKIVDNIADAHPILKVSWIVLSSVYKAVQQQKVMDNDIRILAETLREMVGVAADCPDLRKVEGSTDVIFEISRASLDVASLIDEYTESQSLGGNGLLDKISAIRLF
jgi:hypothetical protein